MARPTAERSPSAPAVSRPTALERLISFLRGQEDGFPLWLGPLLVLLAALFVFLELKPGLIFSNPTPTGGDLGAQVCAAARLPAPQPVRVVA
jgi:hypothetical protein